MIQYRGVTLEKLSWLMRLWETHTPGRYSPRLMTTGLLAIRKHFNVVRLPFSYRHIMRRGGYLNNMLRTLQLCKGFGLRVILAHWPAGMAPEDKEEDYSGRGDQIAYVQYSPCFDSDVQVECRNAMRRMARVIRDNGLTDTILYIDLHQECNGHLTGRFDKEVWESEHQQWGYIHEWTAPQYQAWLLEQYTRIVALNVEWGTNYDSFSDVPIFHTWDDANAAMGNPAFAIADQQDWLCASWKSWVRKLRNQIKAVDNRLLVACSTTTDQEYLMHELYYGVRSSEVCTQDIIAPLVDVIDYHLYGDPVNHGTYIAALRSQYPNKLIIHSETHNVLGEVDIAGAAGSDGICVWSTGGDADRENIVHDWDDGWRVLPFGAAFLRDVARWE